MNLTNEDLNAIGTLIDQKLDKKLDTFEQKVDEKFKKSEKKIIAQMKKETKQIVDFFDKEYLGHDKRIKRIENHLGMSQIVD